MCSEKWEGILNSRLLANHFKELSINYSPPYRENSLWMNRKKAECNKNFIYFFTRIIRLINEEKIDRETFKTEILKIKKLEMLHVEIIWYLEFFQLITIKEFILFHENNSNEDVIEYIAEKIFENLLDQKTNPSEIRKKMILYFFKTSLECLEYSFSHKLINMIIINLKLYYGCEENCDLETYLEVSQLVEIICGLNSDLVKIFFQSLSAGLLENSFQSYKSIFKKQESMKNNVKNKKIFNFFVVMSKYCDLNFMIAILKAKMLDTSKLADWNHMFCFISFIGMHYNGWGELKSLINVIIKEAFQMFNSKLLLNAFLLARQCCFEKSNKSFPSYLQWFSSTFSTELRRLINSKMICKFFFEFLTDISQYDSTYYLKVHINRAPCVPTDCQYILHEYTQLVKTRLSDLNASTELGICENPTTKSAASFDVENVLKHFERTNDILNSVFQASMFCKDYYEKKFLVELLSKFEGKKSVRHKVIMKLHGLGKIPNSMLKVYKGFEKKNK